MKTAVPFLVLFLLAACAGKPDAPSSTAAEDPAQNPTATPTMAPTPAPSPVTDAPAQSPRRNVTLSEPLENDPVRSNPFRVSGTARTFENHVSIRLRNTAGEVIHETYATATGELGSFNPWHEDVLLTTHPGASITVEAFESSAKDGSVQSLVSRTVPFAVPRKRVTLYVHDPARAPTDCSTVFAAEKDVPLTPSLARALVEALIQTSGSPFPRGSEVERIVISNRVATVDFNDRLQNVGGACRAQAIRASVERTLTELPEIDSVAITAGGSSKLALQP